MYFMIRDNNNTRWAYGDVNGVNPSLIEICKYLLTSAAPEIFTIVFFTASEIIENISLVDYAGREQIVSDIPEWRK